MGASFRAVIIIGPTASGKTTLAHFLADSFRNDGTGAELVNLDAFQFYRGVDAGTAKPSPEECREYTYHCIDILEPHETIDAAEYARLASKTCAEIVARGHVPVCVGGSGLYLRAFLHGLDDLPKAHEPLRSFFRECAREWGWPELHDWLKSLDAVRAAELHPNDGVRIERALEIFFASGKPMSAARTRTGRLEGQETLFPAFVVHQDANDTLLRERMALRLPLMMAQGWREEVERLHLRYGEELGGFSCLRAIGYPEILECVKARIPVGDAVLSRIATLTWQYARRQRTWNAKEQQDAACLAGDETQKMATWENVRRWWHE